LSKKNCSRGEGRRHEAFDKRKGGSPSFPSANGGGQWGR